MRIPVNVSVKFVFEVEAEGDGEMPSAFDFQQAVHAVLSEKLVRMRDSALLSSAIEYELDDAVSVYQDYTEVTLNEEQP